MRKYFYEIQFKDGRVVRREHVSKSKAKAMYESMVYEMVLFEVHAASWGVM